MFGFRSITAVWRVALTTWGDPRNTLDPAANGTGSRASSSRHRSKRREHEQHDPGEAPDEGSRQPTQRPAG
jgi:hypothetical protein